MSRTYWEFFLAGFVALEPSWAPTVEAYTGKRWDAGNPHATLHTPPASGYGARVNELVINPEAQEELSRRMAQLGVREADLRESFVRSGGHGGQNVNKTSTCVMLVHLPTGLRVKCQTTRNQGRNRLLARSMLLDKIATRRAGAIAARRAETEKRRRQNRRPSYQARQRMLADKSHRSVKKHLRGRVDQD